MTTHEWRERNEDGLLVFYRAKHHSGVWSFHSRPKDSEFWETHEPVPLEILESFRKVLWNKVQRRRGPEEQIDEIDNMIAGQRVIQEAENASPDAT